MQDSKKVIPSQAKPATVHPCRLSASNESLENSNPDNQSSTLLQVTEVVEGPTSQAGTYSGRAGSDRIDDGTMASEDPSSPCTPHKLASSLDGSTEPQSDLSSPSPRLRAKREKSSGSSRKCHAPMLRDWKWEILSMLTSLGLLAGILATLGRYNDGEQPEWPYNININSLISVLTAVTIAQLGFILAESMYYSLIPLPHTPIRAQFTAGLVVGLILCPQSSASSSGLGLENRIHYRTWSTTTRLREGYLAHSSFLAVLLGSHERE